jgi:diguanylate cyclase (GGDEF)-like protein
MQMSMPSSDDSPIDAPARERLVELIAAAQESVDTGEHERGRDQAGQAVQLAEELGDPELQQRAHNLLATHEFRLGEYEPALSARHRELAISTELADLRGVSRALNGMVLAYHELGLQEEALDHARRSLEAAKQSGDPLTLAWAYNRAGLGHAAVGNIAEGIVSMEFALSLAREIGDEEAVFAALNNLIEDLAALARDLFEQGAQAEARERIARALELAREAVGVARNFDNPYEEAIILLTYGQTLGLAGEHSEAMATLDRARELAEAGGYRAIALGAQYERARLELDRGELREAIAHYRAIIDGGHEVRDARVLRDVHLSLWRAHKQLGEFEAALEHHERYHELERDQQSEMAKTRARVLSTHLDLDRAQLEARRATRQAEIERSRTRELEEQASALRAERELLSQRADQDGLTGLWNRRYIEHELPRIIREAGVRGEPVSVAFVDADHFKAVNDRFGHLVGDDVLRRLAELLRSNVRPTDTVARIGGEEFVVLLPGAGADAAVVLGQRLCDAVREAGWQDLIPAQPLTVSVGIASRTPRLTVPRDLERDEAELLGRADGALYEAKRQGRDRVVLAE